MYIHGTQDSKLDISLLKPTGKCVMGVASVEAWEAAASSFLLYYDHTWSITCAWQVTRI